VGDDNARMNQQIQIAAEMRGFPFKKDKTMRSVLAVVVCCTLLLSTSMAQVAQAPIAHASPSTPVQSNLPTVPAVQKTVPFIALYECELDQCENGGGGAVWLFDGNRGQAMWHYDAVADLTMVQFDGVNIHIHRADPLGSYSSYHRDGGYGQFTGDYLGKITSSNTLEGYSYWNGDTRKEKFANWRATIVNWNFCTDRATKCPLTASQLTILGRRAFEANMYPAAYRCFELAAGMGDADGEGFQATMMMTGWGEKLPAKEIMRRLQDSAGRGSYAGQEGLARAYADGVIVAKDAQQAQYWGAKSKETQARVQQSENANRQLAGKVMSEALIWIVLASTLGGGSGASSPSDEDRSRARMYEEMREGNQREMEDHQRQAEREANLPSW
jgi:hypothetical protein